VIFGDVILDLEPTKQLLLCFQPSHRRPIRPPIKVRVFHQHRPFLTATLFSKLTLEQLQRIYTSSRISDFGPDHHEGPVWGSNIRCLGGDRVTRMVDGIQ